MSRSRPTAWRCSPPSASLAVRSRLDLPRHPCWRCCCSNGVVLAVAARRLVLLAPAPATIDVDRELPARPRRSAARARSRGGSRNPTGRAVRVRVADELAPSLHAGDAAGRVDRARRAGGRPRAPTIATDAVGAGSRRPRSSVRVAGPARAGGPAAPARPAGGPAGVPAVPLARRGRAAHRPGPHPRGRPALGSGRGGGTEFDQLREYQRRRRVPPHRLGGHGPGRQADRAHLPGRAQPDRAACCSTTAGSWPAGSATCPASSTPWTR